MEFYPVHFLWHIASATLFLMSIYSVIIAVRSKLKVFYWYFIFSFFLLLYIQLKSFYFNVFDTNDRFISTVYTIIHWFVQVIYNCAYGFFFIYLLDVKKYIPKFAEFIRKSMVSLFALSVVMAIITLLFNDQNIYVQYFYYGFTPLISLLGITVLIKLWQIPGPLKIFFFIGSLSYMSFAIIALVLSNLYDYNAEDLRGFVPLVAFYTGIIIEQISFGFALGYFTEQLNKKYQNTLQQNLRLKSKHNQDLTNKLKEQSKRLQDIAKEAKEKEVALVKSEYESKLNESRLSSLQSKMNPHFIFNALNSIKAYLIENDKRKAVNYMNRFSKLVRKILESSRIEKVSLEEELEIIKLYIEIENTRFNNSIQFDIENSSDEKKNVFLPPLILQPFIENALWHGLAPSDREKKLSLKVLHNNGYTKVEIEDNGIGRTKSLSDHQQNKLKRKSMGMKMTQERLSVFNQKFNTDYYFEVKDKLLPDTGTLVTLHLN
jgi:sensor histidine kinase YesM